MLIFPLSLLLDHELFRIRPEYFFSLISCRTGEKAGALISAGLWTDESFHQQDLGGESIMGLELTFKFQDRVQTCLPFSGEGAILTRSLFLDS